MKRATSLLPLAWVLGAMLCAVLTTASPVEWAIGDAFDLKIKQVAERVQLGFVFGGFGFDQGAFVPRPGLEISACLQEFSHAQGLAAIESGWPIARIVLRCDQRIAGIDVPFGEYLAIAWISDCKFLLENRWFEPRTPMVILVRESDLERPLVVEDEPWYVLIPSRVALLRESDEGLFSIRCEPALEEPYLNVEDAIVDLCLWNLVRLVVMVGLPDEGAPLAIPTADQFCPSEGGTSLHEALFSP